MKRCQACGLPTPTRLCRFDQRTVELIRSRRCVACRGPVFDQDTQRVEGRCAECRVRNVRLGRATNYLLHLAAQARYDRAQAVTQLSQPESTIAA